jgi:GH24 family phage-related lysozyme (muramidase)
MQELSKKANDLIIKYEVGGGEAYYNKKARFPIWPGGASGVTIGIGVDLGHISFKEFDTYISTYYSTDESSRLAKCIGHTGSQNDPNSEIEMKSLVQSVSDCELSWENALALHIDYTIPIYHKRTLKTFKGIEKLPLDAQGAIVSLVFNRGTRLTGPNRQHMGNIANLISQYTPSNKKTILEEIAKNFEDMISIWEGQKIYEGIKKRRLEEALLIKSCIYLA